MIEVSLDHRFRLYCFKRLLDGLSLGLGTADSLIYGETFVAEVLCKTCSELRSSLLD